MSESRKNILFVSLCLVLLVTAGFLIWQIFRPGNAGLAAEEGEGKSSTKAFYLMEPSSVYLSLGSEGIRGYSKVTRQTDSTLYHSLLEDMGALLDRLAKEEKDPLSLTPSEIDGAQPLLLLQFDMLMDLRVFSAATGLRLEEGAQEIHFKNLLILPSAAFEKPVRICVYDENAGELCELSGGSWEWEENKALLSNVLEGGIGTEPEYYMAGELWPKSFSYGIMVPVHSLRESTYVGSSRSPFAEKEMPDTERMRSYGMSFFTYPDTVTVTKSQESLIFTDEKVSLKLDSKGHVQYVETLTDTEKQPVELKEAYEIARAFLDQDLSRLSSPSLTAILSGYEANGGYTFYFDYALDQIPFLVDEQTLSDWRMSHPVVIYVEGQKVRRYERYAIDISFRGEKSPLKYSYLEIWNQLEQSGGALSVPPYLVYRSRDGYVSPAWCIEREGERLYRSAI